MFRNLQAGDWVFGAGKSSYTTGDQEIALNIQTRVMSFLGDCFFAVDEGIDWWNLLNYNKQEELENAVQQVIIQTPGVAQLIQLESYINANRQIRIVYEVRTVNNVIIKRELNPIEVQND